MARDFFEATESNLSKLNQTEKQLFEYVVKNMHHIKNMSIQKFAEGQFLSTTTIFRFVQKLGFDGYTDFINSLLVTSHSNKDMEIPDIMYKKDYSEEYLKNIIETTRVMSSEFVARVSEVFSTKRNIYILTDDNAHTIGQYSEKLFLSLGFKTYFPETAYQTQPLVDFIKSDDVIIALSYSGEDAVLLDFIKRTFINEKPFLISITGPKNNVLESLSDVNFYVFAEEIVIGGMDVTSCVPMMAVIELLVYEIMGRKDTCRDQSM